MLKRAARLTTSFLDNTLTVPGYQFKPAFSWDDVGSMTLLAEGTNLKDGSNVLAKLAPAHTDGSLCLEREAHILGRLNASTDSVCALGLLEFHQIPLDKGNHVVLVMSHPGSNQLGRYFKGCKANDFLLSEKSTSPLLAENTPNLFMTIPDTPLSEFEALSIDLATFLEFAIQACHCLQVLHKLGFVHREVRANAFHLNPHSGHVRLVHFGNRAVSLEQLGGPSRFVLQADALEDTGEKARIRDALCYLAPEQTGALDATSEDHRTDLYALGVVFWLILVGGSTLPFEGGPSELLHTIVQSRPRPVHEVRRDVPRVISAIIDKLLSKQLDSRYNSTTGLLADLVECQKRLNVSVNNTSGNSSELIPSFEIGTNDRFLDFTLPTFLYGREKDVETIRNVVRQVTAAQSHLLGSGRGSSSVVISPTASQPSNPINGSEDHSESTSSEYSEPAHMPISTTEALDDPPTNTANAADNNPSGLMSPVSSTGNSFVEGSKRTSQHSTSLSRPSRAHTIVVCGPPGIGKSALITSHQVRWRSHGLWGQAKFTENSIPYNGILSCLSSVLRQLMVVPADVRLFVERLQDRLGNQVANLSLLFSGAPEIGDLLSLFKSSPSDRGSTVEQLTAGEQRARFQYLVEVVFEVLASIRMLALFMDDLQFADEASLSVISSLANAKGRMLLLVSTREDPTTAGTFFSSRSRTTWITLEPLSHSSVLALVAKTLGRDREDCIPLSRFCHRISGGNPFAVRNLLTSFRRQNKIYFDANANCWNFHMDAIEASQIAQPVDPNNISYFVEHLKELPDLAREFILWGGLLGSTFKVAEVISLMQLDEPGNGDALEHNEHWKEHTVPKSIGPMKGMHMAMTEGWIVQRARDKCSFAHDCHRQAADAYRDGLQQEVRQRMLLKVISMLLCETPVDVPRVAEYCKRAPDALQGHPRREEFLEYLLEASTAAASRGAHEQALDFYLCANDLSGINPWAVNHNRTMSMRLHTAELLNWKGETSRAGEILAEILDHSQEPEEKAEVLRLRSHNHFLVKDFGRALSDILLALELLGVAIDAKVSRREADALFDTVQNEILKSGFESILAMPTTENRRARLVVKLLNDAGTAAYWSTAGEGFSDVIGLATIQESLRNGMCPGSALGFFWTLGASAERRGLYRFSVELGRLGLEIAKTHGTTAERCKSLLMYTAMIAGYENVHLRSQLPRLETALQLAHSAGDRIYGGFIILHRFSIRLWCCDHLTEIIPFVEDAANDISTWLPESHYVYLMNGVIPYIHLLSGSFTPSGPRDIYEGMGFVESQFLKEVHAQPPANIEMVMNWYNSFKTAALYLFGWHKEASELGFSVYGNRQCHPNHRHARFGLFFHALALIQTLRVSSSGLSEETRRLYLDQIELNYQYLRMWLSPSPINNATWIAIIDAERASLQSLPESFKLYDSAVTLAINNEWLLEEGLALYLEGAHFIRHGLESLGSELQRRGITRQTQWGAHGIARSLQRESSHTEARILKRRIFAAEVAVQTDSALTLDVEQARSPDAMEVEPEDELGSLNATDLASIIRWNHAIASDINITTALQRLTEIATKITSAQFCSVAICYNDTDLLVATTLIPPAPCQVFDNPRPVRSIGDPLRRHIHHDCITSKRTIFLPDGHADEKYASSTARSSDVSCICVPIISARSQIMGMLYTGSKNPFTAHDSTLLTLLSQQASVSLSNSLLYASVQAATKANMRMITSQREALEEARKSREEALKATKIKSNFLASMSHELRTPFSSFYGLLDLLGGTNLNSGQSEIVHTAKQSCELLLKIIDSILDYSKLEAEALRIDVHPFMVEDVIADCMELLLPIAVKKLDMAYNIAPEVPKWVVGDYARVRQVLMNLLGNGLKFTSSGFVHVSCLVDDPPKDNPDGLKLKFEIQDSGIGLSENDIESLFMPFQQADNSSTRRFGGTGLGLSISRELIKLMKGEIGVKAKLGEGSSFWFTITVERAEPNDLAKTQLLIDTIKRQLKGCRILIASSSDTTLKLLSNMLGGLDLITASSVDTISDILEETQKSNRKLDFVVLDSQADEDVKQIVDLLDSWPAFADCHIVHYFTPTPETLSRDPGHTPSPRVVRTHKPPRTVKLLQQLTSLKGILSDRSAIGGLVSNDIAAVAASKRTLYGNVLIAEDNSVAQGLLIKQLEKYQLQVTATSNGEEAVNEWNAHEPGYFSVALFDHHMPICDGVEACKRIRELESKRKATKLLPIVALSADCQPSVQQLCLSAGMSHFLTKPLRKGDLATLLTMF